MWARVDDHLDEHKKVYIAGSRLGGANATGRVLAVWLEGRLWSNRNNTLGFVPASIVRSFRHDEDPMAVAAALSAPITDDERVQWNTDSVNCLWVACDGGYRYHDDAHYRPRKSPEEVSAARSASGRRGGLASAVSRQQKAKQIASSNAKQTSKQMAEQSGPSKQPDERGASEATKQMSQQRGEQSAKQFASNAADGPIDAQTGKQTKQNEQQNSNPVSRYPVPGSEEHENRRAVCVQEAEPDVAAFVDRWNAVFEPLGRRCLGLPAERRDRIRERLRELTLDEWSDVFRRLAASDYCSGKNTSGWKASLDWLIKDAVQGLRVLEGQFDSERRVLRPISSPERERALKWLSVNRGCPHVPTCASPHVCVGNLVWLWRAEEEGEVVAS